MALRILTSLAQPWRRVDFNGDTFSDLAIGIPVESNEAAANFTGRVVVIYGSPNGLEAVAPLVPSQSFEIADFDFNLPVFKRRIRRAGDFDGNRITDLAIGIPSSTRYQLPSTRHAHIGLDK
jgi:hypothetical protein